MTGHMLHMATMGLVVSVLAPTLLMVLIRAFPQLDRCTVPAAVALPGFVALHGAATVFADRGPIPTPWDTAAHLALLIGAMLFWAPVLGARRRLPDAGRMVYLYLAIPLLDLAGVWLVAVGDSPGGLSMIVGMLPMGMAAVALTWNWISREERRAVLAEAVGGSSSTANPGGLAPVSTANPASTPNPAESGRSA